MKYSSGHELVGHDAQSEVVNSVGVIHLANDFWSHISWCATSILSVIWFNLS